MNSRYNEVLGTCKFLRYIRIIINAFSALGENLHFVISGYFVISDLVITGVLRNHIIQFIISKYRFNKRDVRQCSDYFSGYSLK